MDSNSQHPRKPERDHEDHLDADSVDRFSARPKAAQRDRVIVALDLPDVDKALRLVDVVRPYCDFFKVGSKLFVRDGHMLLAALAERKCRVFLDLKFYDIPSVIEESVRQVEQWRHVELITVHASGGAEMISRASVAAGALRARRAEDRHSRGGGPRILAVTALTSLGEDALGKMGVQGSLQDWVMRLAELALQAGADGLVSSPREVERLREAFGAKPLLVTPGVRPRGWQASGDDQTRVSTPTDALEAGSDYLVIGRPVYASDDPKAVLVGLFDEQD